MFIRADQSTGVHIARESVEYVCEAIGCLHEERVLKSPSGGPKVSAFLTRSQVPPFPPLESSKNIEVAAEWCPPGNAFTIVNLKPGYSYSAYSLYKTSNSTLHQDLLLRELSASTPRHKFVILSNMQKTFGPAKGDSAEPLRKRTQIYMS